MIKKNYKKFYITILIGIIFYAMNVKAKCSNETQYALNVASSNVSMNYSIDTFTVDSKGNLHPEIPVDQIEVNELSEYTITEKMSLKIENVTDKIYVVLRSDEESINQMFHYEDLENGRFVYDIPNTDIIRHFELTIYSNESECIDEELRKIEVTTPKYNDYAGYGICENNNAYYCKKYVTSDIDEEIFDKYEKENKKNKEKENNTNIENNKKYNILKIILIIIIPIAFIVLIIIIIYLIIKKRRKKDIVLRNIGGN